MTQTHTDDAVTFRPSLLSLPPFSPSVHRRRLSATFVDRTRPVAWISLQGRLLNAELASSATTIGLTGAQSIAWDLFPPIHRFLIVAVIGVAAAESHKNKRICQLNKSVQLRDQVLSSMQQKLDNLCEELTNKKEHSLAATKDEAMQLTESFGTQKMKFVDCGCCHCEQHSGLFNELMQGESVTTASGGNDVLQYKLPFSHEDPEERRMSDFSDWASSVTSAADIQLNSMTVEQDICNLKRDCEEKDNTINELSTLLNCSEVANNKRVTELEDIIRRKNTTISKLKKDLVVLEQKIVQLTRLRRASFSANDSNNVQFPHMRENLIYDMESTTSPSSSDSDSFPVNNARVFPVDAIVLNQEPASGNGQKSAPAKVFSSSGRVFERHSKSQSMTPFKEASAIKKSTNAVPSSSQKQLSPRGDLKKIRRRSLNGAKSATAHKRLVL